MLPNWLRSCNKVEWNSPKEGVDLNLVILPDSSDWEKIIRVPFIPKGRVGPRRGHHSQNDSNRLSEPQKPRDPMRCMISDGDYPIGMQLLDPNHDYTTGPYKPVEDNGHKIVTQYGDTLKLSKGLTFELYRYQSTERYTINYIEITVYLDSKPV
ncbi:unnamed protein product [Porites evermanni]|uniref:Uncharacterized protein n=1 Tax=Porites evermanni TaxID=104178 RepID=A0ABN8LQ79_9CNID|nr:unnamed protein product [Porites evermanni]